ncbi:hypothetical protein NMH_1400 [Neisseria meningitidis H44/76]|uniref:Uncharacterized protein n=4 Tax=Neisseria meningitidis TaxID=487 RepID=A0A0H5DM41_NEIMI|nr:hypothetical protein NMH_1400 [Neisseria meningitidis H44/76]KER40451.1 hypothetical protein F528_0558 [Neisseria meningitidis 992008]CBA04711.1 hypothetical protein predicted by Glimmer/Critica [Neisseria meningitidis alpha275]CCA44042.1 hypothetical protein NMALPHA522_0501 [Neisseria meningitidis alpha522]CRL92316.1 hypothetical protein [Neisseria meningitidis serogroup B]
MRIDLKLQNPNGSDYRFRVSKLRRYRKNRKSKLQEFI